MRRLLQLVGILFLFSYQADLNAQVISDWQTGVTTADTDISFKTIQDGHLVYILYSIHNLDSVNSRNIKFQLRWKGRIIDIKNFKLAPGARVEATLADVEQKLHNQYSQFSLPSLNLPVDAFEINILL